MIRAVIFDMFETLITHYQSPLYFGTEMAKDAGIPKEKFLELWEPTGQARTIGKMTLEEALEMILRKNQCFSESLLKKILNKRVAAKEECFRHLHPEIIPMLTKLKEKGLLIGLISNCFSEEVTVIRQSALFPYFDAAYLSYEQGVQKPDEAIFCRCMEKLSVMPNECLYIGDGGSYELETAEKLGMRAIQATWYFQEGMPQLLQLSHNFLQAESPFEILNYLED